MFQKLIALLFGETHVASAANIRGNMSNGRVDHGNVWWKA